MVTSLFSASTLRHVIVIKIFSFHTVVCYCISFRMFVQPLYCGVLFDQGMLLNRHKDDYEDMKGVDEKIKLSQKDTLLKKQWHEEDNVKLQNVDMRVDSHHSD